MNSTERGFIYPSRLKQELPSVAYIPDIRGQVWLYSFCRKVRMSFVREQSVDRPPGQSRSSAWKYYVSVWRNGQKFVLRVPASGRTTSEASCFWKLDNFIVFIK
jgi:hypothetical protein